MKNEMIVFDLDGTIRDHSHRAHHILREDGDTRPKEWDDYFLKCGGDAPIPHMVGTARQFLESGHNVAFWTGAKELGCSRALTLRWLRDQGLPGCTELRMRQEGDHRRDDILKKEWLDITRENGTEVTLAFEDRKRVVDMWRANDVLCVQVAPGDF